MGVFKLFNKKQPKTMLDQAQQAAFPLIVNGFRHIAKTNNVAPTPKTTDHKIVEIYQKVLVAFKKGAEQRGERIPAVNLNAIALKFFQVYEMMGEQMFEQHLDYEVLKYIREGA
jgi:hypothetical protein